MSRKLLLGLEIFQTVISVAFDDMLVFATPTLGFELNHANFARLIIFDSTLSDLLDVHRTEYHVFDKRIRSLDGKVFPSALQVHILEAHRLHLQARNRKPHLHIRLHQEFVML